MAKGIRHHETGPVRNPGVNVPAGMLKVTLHDVELTAPSLCFGVIKIGPHWGRTATVTAAPKGTWDWEVSSISLWHHSCIKYPSPSIISMWSVHWTQDDLTSQCV